MQEAAKKQLLKSTDSEKELLIWGIPIEKVDEMAALGIPLAASGDIGILEVFNPKKRQYNQSEFLRH
ncbi:GAF domain-containing protein [Vaginella massiliensis]|uniref:GAF domain-containing protein n=1 Tax=Vaginella massiliensis TaxID=1816680 RepID=UPI000838EA58|nr:GAF domain-containing protein [Vaginella massiliensis]